MQAAQNIRELAEGRIQAQQYTDIDECIGIYILSWIIPFDVF